VEHLGGAAPDVLTTTIIAGGRRHLRVSGKLLHGADVNAEVEHVANERPSKIVGREAAYPGSTSEAPHEIQDALIGQAAHHDPAALRHGHEERNPSANGVFRMGVRGRTRVRDDNEFRDG